MENTAKKRSPLWLKVVLVLAAFVLFTVMVFWLFSQNLLGNPVLSVVSQEGSTHILTYYMASAFSEGSYVPVILLAGFIVSAVAVFLIVIKDKKFKQSVK